MARPRKHPLPAPRTNGHPGFADIDEAGNSAHVDALAARAKNRVVMNEIAVMAMMKDALAPLQSDAQARVMVWLNSFYESLSGSLSE